LFSDQAVKKTIMLHGRMYLSENYLCFYSNIFSLGVSIVVPIIDITGVTKANQGLIFDNALKVFLNTLDPPEFYFGSFAPKARNQVYTLLSVRCVR
jgi:hypothetical protein